MADSECTSGKMALIRCGEQSNLADSSLESNLFNNLCDELVAEILLRLPSKSAARLQVVCKRWYSLISSPHFIPRFIHLRHHRDVESSVVFQYSYRCDDRKCNCNQRNSYHSEFQIMSDGCSLLRNLPIDHLIWKGSSADLILCSTIFYPYFFLVINLLTRQWIALPPPPPCMEDPVGFLCVPPPCSQCKPVDSSHHKFMVVMLCADNRFAPSQFDVQMFSSEDYKWRTLVISLSLPPSTPFEWETPFVSYRGILYWLRPDSILVYDPLNTPNTFSRIIHLPIQLYPFIPTNSLVGVSQDRLRVVEISYDDDGVHQILDVWEFKDYGSGLWNLVYKVHLKNLIHNGLPESELCCFCVSSLHPENGDVIYLQIPTGLVLLNMKNRIIEGYYPMKKKAGCSRVKAFHLADPWWPTPVSSLH